MNSFATVGDSGAEKSAMGKFGRRISALLVLVLISSRVWAAPTITTQPATPLSVPLGTGFTLTVAATSSGGALSYQWSDSGTAITGANSATYTDSSSSSSDGGSYTCAVTDSNGTTTSAAAVVTITYNGTAITTSPLITIQPTNLTAVYNADGTVTPVNLGVAAVSSLTLTYQWYLNGTAITGATGAIYGATSPGSYTVAVSTAAPATVMSSAGVVSLATPGGTSVANVPNIATQPVGGTVIYATTPYTLSVSAVALLPMTYQWYLNGNIIAGATGTTLSVTAPGSYTVVVTDTAGTVTSNAAVVNVTTAGGVAVTTSPTITVQPVSGSAVYTGGPVSLGLSVTALALTPLTYQWSLNGVAISGAVGATYTATVPGSYSVAVSTATASITSQTATFTVTTPSGTAVGTSPTITTQPIGGTIVYGSTSGTATLSVSALALQPLSYQWYLNGVAIAGATSASYAASQAGSYSVTVTTAAGSVTSTAAQVIAGVRVVNLSSRVVVGPSSSATAGFVLSSPTGAAKQLLIRAVGPGLTTFGVSGVLAHPVLNVYSASGALVASNGGWANSPAVIAANAATGAFPLAANSADAATIVTLAPAPYSIQVSSGDGTSGAALVEVYELASDGTQLVNISTLATAGSGNNTLIAGFVVTGTQSAQVLIRAAGPGLAAYGVTGALAQPTLTVTGGGGTLLLGTNTGWSSGSVATTAALTTAMTATGAFPFAVGSADSAVLVTLPPGAYTAQVTGPNGLTGRSLAEVYLVPAN
jgi:hypothetical protein